MHYFTYILKHQTSDKYYVGRHSTNNIEDNYFGSGRWPRSIKNKSLLSREILNFYLSEEELLIAEEELLKQHFGKPNCMNFNEKSVGFSSVNNPNKSDEARKRNSERVKGDKNPMYGKHHTEEYRQRLSIERKGIGNHFFGKQHTNEAKQKMSIAKKGKKASLETIQKQSEMRKGKPAPCSFKGRKHTEEAKEIMRQNALNRPGVYCQYCDREVKLNVIQWHNENCKNKSKS